MAILVLGGAGYIGSHTALELVKAGNEVVIADNLVTGYRKAIPEGAKFYEGDLRDSDFLDNLFHQENIDAVIHFAAYSLVGESVTNPLKYYDNNLYGTKVLLEAMVKNNVGKIVFSSTAATYGEPENIPILESDRTCPTNPYGETKLAMEKMFKWTAEAHGLRYVSLRYFNACGADESGTIGEAHNPESHLIPLILQVPNGKRETISIYGTDYDTPVLHIPELHDYLLIRLFLFSFSDMFIVVGYSLIRVSFTGVVFRKSLPEKLIIKLSDILSLVGYVVGYSFTNNILCDKFSIIMFDNSVI